MSNSISSVGATTLKYQDVRQAALSGEVIPVKDGGLSISPKVPYLGVVPDGLVVGKSIGITGLILSGRDKKFTINLSCGLLIDGDKQDDIALHIDSRFDDNILVLNTLKNNQWGVERRFPNPFKRGQALRVYILALSDRFLLSIDGKNLCEYEYQFPLQSIRSLYIRGCVKIDFIEYHQTGLSKSIAGGDDVKTSRISYTDPIYDPPVPFKCPLPSTLKPEGCEIRVTGTVRLHPYCIQVNLKTPQGDKVLHISVRFNIRDEDVVVLNSQRNGNYEDEIRNNYKFPFQAGGTFDLYIVPSYSGFNIKVAGRYYMHFPYRFPLEHANELEIKGDLKLLQVHFLM